MASDLKIDDRKCRLYHYYKWAFKVHQGVNTQICELPGAIKYMYLNDLTFMYFVARVLSLKH